MSTIDNIPVGGAVESVLDNTAEGTFTVEDTFEGGVRTVLFTLEQRQYNIAVDRIVAKIEEILTSSVGDPRQSTIIFEVRFKTGSEAKNFDEQSVSE
jgi:hypothetical protein